MKTEHYAKQMGIILFLSCYLLLSSCAAPGHQGSNDAAKIGAGAGALVGAILGQAIGRDTAGTLIGAAVGGLAGWAIGSQVGMKSTKVYDQQETEKMVTGPVEAPKVLEIHSQNVMPSQVRPGEKVTVRVAYMVIDRKTGSVPVREKKTLWYNGQEQSVFDDSVISRDNGTWESSIEILVPPTAEKGHYTVSHDITVDNIVRRAKTDFMVI